MATVQQTTASQSSLSQFDSFKFVTVESYTDTYIASVGEVTLQK